jgi:hypothetical protein
LTDVVKDVVEYGGDKVVLVTGRWMPKPDLESSLLVSAPRELGVTVIVQPWEEPLDRAAAPLVVVRTTWKIEPGLFLDRDSRAPGRFAKHIEALLPSRSPRR